MHFYEEFTQLRFYRSRKQVVESSNLQFNHEKYFLDRKLGSYPVFFENLVATKQDVGFRMENLMYRQILNPIREYSFLF